MPATLHEQVIVRREPEKIGVAPGFFHGVCAILRDPDDFTNAWFVMKMVRLSDADFDYQTSVEHPLGAKGQFASEVSDIDDYQRQQRFLKTNYQRCGQAASSVG